MYRLILTKDERMAIDWIGNRYRHGTELFKLIWLNCEPKPICKNADKLMIDNWYESYDIEFLVPEHIAWSIKEIVDERNSLACFADGFKKKLHDFCSKIV